MKTAMETTAMETTVIETESLRLAAMGVALFAVRANSKIALWTDFPNKATADEIDILQFVGQHNTGIRCGQYGKRWLVAIDIDDKDGKRGFETVAALEDEGSFLPPTWSQITPSGGKHFLYWSTRKLRQGTNTLGEGIDTRCEGGYIVGPGSSTSQGFYSPGPPSEISDAPKWLEEYLLSSQVVAAPVPRGKPVEDQDLAAKRATEYLQSLAPASAGGRSNEAFKASARVRDFGVWQGTTELLMLNYFRSTPEMDHAEIRAVVSHAYQYSKNEIGKLAPEKQFEKIPEPEYKDPVLDLNKEFFYYAADGVERVCWETKRNGRNYLERLQVDHFHRKLCAVKTMANNKLTAVTKQWIESETRRTYDYLRFDPSHSLEANAYNLWKGFAISPSTDEPSAEATKAVDLFFQHCLENVCQGKQELFDWFVNYLAHIFQFPGDKPEVALVFKGQKGTGKTFVAEVVNHLIGDNSVILSDKTHALGHFNSIMEDKLLVTLEEAFWSGDKSIEGILKDLISGSTRVITHKGAEPYKAKVFDRVIIIGNENWLVPATADERRFAVFNIGRGWMQNRAIFGLMANGLFKHGGDRLLMKRLTEIKVDRNLVNCAPDTEGLDEQKIHSLGVFERWWLNCLQEGQIIGSGLEDWPTEYGFSGLYHCFLVQLHTERYKGHPPHRNTVAKAFKNIYGCNMGEKMGNKVVYILGTLEQARKQFEKILNLKADWET